MLKALALIAVSVLAACSSAQPDQLSVLRAALSTKPPAALVAPCPRPVVIKPGPMNSNEVAQSWLTDRISLATCDKLDAAVVQYYTGRDAALLKLTQ